MKGSHIMIITYYINETKKSNKSKQAAKINNDDRSK